MIALKAMNSKLQLVFSEDNASLCTGARNSSRGGSMGRVQGLRTPPEMTCGFPIQLVFCKKKTTMWFIGVEVHVEQETSAPPPEINPGSAPASLAY